MVLQLDKGDKILYQETDGVWTLGVIIGSNWGQMTVDVHPDGIPLNGIETIPILRVLLYCELVDTWYRERYLPKLHNNRRKTDA